MSEGITFDAKLYTNGYDVIILSLVNDFIHKAIYYSKKLDLDNIDS